MLWLCVDLPQFSLEVHTRAFADKTRPVVIGEERRVWGANVAASNAGICAGMRISNAQALCGALTIVPRDLAAETAALERLAGWAGQFSSYVSLAPPRALLLEIGASVKLFGRLATLCSDIRTGLHDLGFHALLALAPTPTAARWLAQSGRPVSITQCRELASALRPLPLTCLPLAPAILAALKDLSLTSLGDCLRLPRPGLIARFGQAFIDDLDRALGRAPDLLPRYAPPARFEGRLAFPEEVDNSEPLLFACARLVRELTGFLRATATCVQRLDIDLLAPQRAPQRLALGLVAPTRDAAHLLALLRERLQHLPLASPVQEIGMRADTLIAWQATPQKLFHEAGAPKKDPAALVEQLQARLGAKAVQGLATLADHRPHRAWQYYPAMSKRRVEMRLNRPLWLLPAPAPIESPQAPRLQLMQGPERIEGGWWDGEDIARDYFIAANAQGARLWIFKERQGERRWFTQGLFA